MSSEHVLSFSRSECPARHPRCNVHLGGTRSGHWYDQFDRHSIRMIFNSLSDCVGKCMLDGDHHADFNFRISFNVVLTNSDKANSTASMLEHQSIVRQHNEPPTLSLNKSLLLIERKLVKKVKLLSGSELSNQKANHKMRIVFWMAKWIARLRRSDKIVRAQATQNSNSIALTNPKSLRCLESLKFGI